MTENLKTSERKSRYLILEDDCKSFIVEIEMKKISVITMKNELITKYNKIENFISQEEEYNAFVSNYINAKVEEYDKMVRKLKDMKIKVEKILNQAGHQVEDDLFSMWVQMFSNLKIELGIILKKNICQKYFFWE